MSTNFSMLGIWFLVFLFSTTAHEAAHAWAGNLGGDSTARQGGHMTLDPIVHIKRSPFGMVVVPILSFMNWGWMMGWASVPFDRAWGKRYPKRQALMSVAGPAANFALALAGLAVAKVLVTLGIFELNGAGLSRLVVPANPTASSLVVALAGLLSVLVNLNIILGAFNLMPIPPLDGGGVLEGLFPRSVGRLFEHMEKAPVWGLVGLVAAWQVAPYVIFPVQRLLVGSWF